MPVILGPRKNIAKIYKKDKGEWKSSESLNGTIEIKFVFHMRDS